MRAARLDIDPSVVRRLVAAQFPEWRGLPIERVEPGGWDHRTFRLGPAMVVRLPSAERYAAQVEKEQRWLPRLAPHLPVAIPVPVAQGEPADGYPWPWSIYRWLEGETASAARVDDRPRLAVAVAAFLAALHRIDPTGGPAPGRHNFFRGGAPGVYDGEVRRAVAALDGRIDRAAVVRAWSAALDSAWPGPPVWVHGDVSATNLLVRDDRLSAVIDFGSAAVGDPACDLTIAWTLFSGASRAAFRAALPLDAATWARARGWALWKALITLGEDARASAPTARAARQVLDEVTAEAAPGRYDVPIDPCPSNRLEECDMTAPSTAWPTKTRELHSHHFDSTIWNDLQFRDDDIIISTYAKAGTTWVQQMIGQMMHGGDPDLEVAELSPWLDLRVPPKEVKLPQVEAQTNRRFLKTHLPVDALVYSPQAKYLYIGRDGRDVVWSMHNHHFNANQTWYDLLNDTPGRVGPPIEPPPESRRQYFLDWLDGDGFPFWSFWENIRTWWAIRDLPNLLLLHYTDLKADMPGQMRRIAAFLEIPIDESRWDRIVEYCSFDWMKANATKAVPLGGAFWDAGAGVFINKGRNGVWRDELTDEDSKRYEALAEAELGAEAAAWLANGAG